MLILISSLSIFAQSPEKFNYQAVVRDQSGNVVSNKQVSLRISILKGSTFGTYVLVENHTPETNKYGIVNLIIGEGTVSTGSLSGIDWSDGPYFIKIDIDATGGENYSELGTTQLISVPYSLYSNNSGHSKTADNVVNLDYEQLNGKPDLSQYQPVSGTETWDKDYTNDVLITGDQEINGKKTFGDSAIFANILRSTISSSTAVPIVAENKAETGTANAIYGVSSSSSGTAIRGISPYIGVYGSSSSTTGYGYGVYGTSSSETSAGVYGYCNNSNGKGVAGFVYSTSSGEGAGVLGTAYNSGSSGVRGVSSAYSGECYGVYGSALSVSGRAVFGEALNTSGVTYGTVGISKSPNGYGVYGQNTAETGNAYGVYGSTASATGRAVFGNASSFTGENYGVYGRTSSSGGFGVYGYCSSSTGAVHGVHGETESTTGYGVYGVSNATTGSTKGVYGEARSPYGIGVYGLTAGNGINFGVYGITYSDNKGTGVYGISYQHSGVSYGVRANCQSTSGYDFYADGDGVNYGAPSSIRWKYDIVPMTSVLDKIKEIRSVYFTWDQEHGGNHDLGFIGEEVAKSFPEVVAADPASPGYVTGMDYSKMTPILLQAINEQQVIIENQNSKIEKQNLLIEDLIKRIEALETK